MEEAYVQKKIKQGSYGPLQQKQIRYCNKQGLTIEQIEFVANPCFDAQQMGEIRCGFAENLSMDQVKLYAQCGFRWTRMWELRKCIRQGIDVAFVQMMVDDDNLRDTQIEQLRIFYDKGATLDQLQMCIDQRLSAREIKHYVESQSEK